MRKKSIRGTLARNANASKEVGNVSSRIYELSQKLNKETDFFQI